jgi:hypothetical protein
LSAIAARTLDSFGRRRQTYFSQRGTQAHLGVAGFGSGDSVRGLGSLSPENRGTAEEAALDPRLSLGRHPFPTMKAATTVANRASGVNSRIFPPYL